MNNKTHTAHMLIHIYMDVDVPTNLQIQHLKYVLFLIKWPFVSNFKLPELLDFEFVNSLSVVQCSQLQTG